MSASKPPSFSGVPKKPKATKPVQDVITDGRVPSPAERERRYDLRGIPASVRHDRVRPEAALARQQIGADEDASELASWKDIRARNARQDDGRTMSFHVPAFPPTGGLPAPRVDRLGRSIPRSTTRWG